MDYPKIRSLEAFPVKMSGGLTICLRDGQNFSSKMFFLPQNLFYLITLMDGKNAILDLQAAYMRKFGQLIYQDEIKKFVEELDSNLLLDSENFAAYKKKLYDEFKALKSRPASHAGLSYEVEPEKLKLQIDNFFTPPQGPGLPSAEKRPDGLKAIIAPHIDLRNGGPCYAHAYKEVVERASPEVVVILGTCHSEMKTPYALSSKEFDTPFGPVECHKDIIERIISLCPFDPFQDEFAHRSEHTVEFQLIFLKRWLGELSSFKIVPVLCASLHEYILSGEDPGEDPQVGGFLKALKAAVEPCGARTLYVASADLSHVGLRYGDNVPPDLNSLRAIADADLDMLNHVQKLDAPGFFKSVASGGDRRRICGLSPIYTLLKMVDANECRLLKYDQLFDKEGGYMVSYASMALS